MWACVGIAAELRALINGESSEVLHGYEAYRDRLVLVKDAGQRYSGSSDTSAPAL